MDSFALMYITLDLLLWGRLSLALSSSSNTSSTSLQRDCNNALVRINALRILSSAPHVAWVALKMFANILERQLFATKQCRVSLSLHLLGKHSY